MTDVPVHIQEVPTVRQGVVVTGGTNIDLSISAAPTPITRVEVRMPPPPPPPAVVPPLDLKRTPYRPGDAIPAGDPFKVLTFAKDSAVVPPKAFTADELKALRKGRVVIAGHADSDEQGVDVLSSKRAGAVAKMLRTKGVPVKLTTVASFGAGREVTEYIEQLERNRRVEVFVQPVVAEKSSHKKSATKSGSGE